MLIFKINYKMYKNAGIFKNTYLYYRCNNFGTIQILVFRANIKQDDIPMFSKIENRCKKHTLSIADVATLREKYSYRQSFSDLLLL